MENNKMTRNSANILLCTALLIIAVPVQGDDWAPGYPIGSTVISVNALDQHETPRNFDNLKGTTGLLLLFNRSTTW